MDVESSVTAAAELSSRADCAATRFSISRAEALSRAAESPTWRPASCTSCARCSRPTEELVHVLGQVADLVVARRLEALRQVAGAARDGAGRAPEAPQGPGDPVGQGRRDPERQDQADPQRDTESLGSRLARAVAQEVEDTDVRVLVVVLESPDDLCMVVPRLSLQGQRAGLLRPASRKGGGHGALQLVGERRRADPPALRDQDLGPRSIAAGGLARIRVEVAIDVDSHQDPTDDWALPADGLEG